MRRNAEPYRRGNGPSSRPLANAGGSVSDALGSVSTPGTMTHDWVVAWLGKHPRFQLHFTPTSSSWLNLVERWFSPTKPSAGGYFRSVPDLIAAIEDYLAANNNDPGRRVDRHSRRGDPGEGPPGSRDP